MEEKKLSPKDRLKRSLTSQHSQRCRKTLKRCVIFKLILLLPSTIFLAAKLPASNIEMLLLLDGFAAVVYISALIITAVEFVLTMLWLCSELILKIHLALTAAVGCLSAVITYNDYDPFAALLMLGVTILAVSPQVIYLVKKKISDKKIENVLEKFELRHRKSTEINS